MAHPNEAFGRCSDYRLRYGSSISAVRYLRKRCFDYRLRYSRVRSVSALLAAATSLRDDYYLYLPERSGG